MILIIILICYNLSILFEAFWDAEAFKSGDSNHTWKVLDRAIYLTGFVLVGIAYDTIIKLIILISLYTLFRYTLFDYILNLKRGEDMDYKTSPVIYKFISLISIMVLIYTYFKI